MTPYDARSTRAVRAETIALAVVVSGVGRALHAWSDPAASIASHAGHVALDAVLALPLAFLAVLAGRWSSRRAGAARPLVTAATLAAGLIPASAVHEALGRASAAGEHGHDAVAHIWTAAHAAREALPAFFAVLAVAILAPQAGRIMTPLRPLLLRGRLRPMRVALALAALAAALPARLPVAAAAVEPFTSPLVIPAERTEPDISIDMRESLVQILPGAPTKMWTYDGTFPGPTIRRPSGIQTRVTFSNNLPAAVGSTTVHHHGNHSASSEDGQPDTFLIPTGGARTYTYDFVEDGKPERAAMQWYHDHRMDVTGRNVWMGLAGMVILDDDVDGAMPLPRGQYDVPLMVVDRKFDADNQLVYSNNPAGMRGDTLLVNGVVQPYFDVTGHRYRLRLFNASNVAEYEFAFPGGMTMTQIGTESGLLPAPVTRTSIRLGPAERADVVVDFAGHAGEKIVLGNTAGFGALRQVMQFRVGPDAADDTAVPAMLRPADPIPELDVIGTRVWALTQSVAGNPVWTINGQGYASSRIDTAPLHPKRGSAERWIFVNTTPVNHVMHIHDVDWWLIRRVSAEPYPDEALAAEMGLKESFIVRPNEVVEIVSRFTDHVGTYVFHCHVLEHEDNAMMAQFAVVP